MCIAHGMAMEAERKMVIIRPEACETCGCDEKTLVKHHRDYLEPLKITWLCRSCHALEHRSGKLPPMPWWLRAECYIERDYGESFLDVASVIRKEYRVRFERTLTRLEAGKEADAS